MKKLIFGALGIAIAGLSIETLFGLSSWVSLVMSSLIVLSIIPFAKYFLNRKVRTVGSIQQIKSDRDGSKCWLVEIKVEDWQPKKYKCYVNRDNTLDSVKIGVMIESALNDSSVPKTAVGVIEGSQQTMFVNRHTETGFGRAFTQYKGWCNFKEFDFDLVDA